MWEQRRYVMLMKQKPISNSDLSQKFEMDFFELG